MPQKMTSYWLYRLSSIHVNCTYFSRTALSLVTLFCCPEKLRVYPMKWAHVMGAGQKLECARARILTMHGVLCSRRTMEDPVTSLRRQTLKCDCKYQQDWQNHGII